MSSALQQFQAQHPDERDKHRKLKTAAGIGAGTTAAMSAVESTRAMLRDAQEQKVRATRGFSDFTSKLQPGDILFHRRPVKNSALEKIGNYQMPFTEADELMSLKGDPYYHGSIYMGRGKIGDAYDGVVGVRKNTPIMPETAEDIKAYRPQVPQKAKDRALQYVKDMHGARYKDMSGLLEHGANHLLNPVGKKTSLTPAEASVCTELVANAYPSIFKDAYAGPEEMRHAKGMQLIARYNPMGKITPRETITSRIIHPTLKNLKYGLLAGGLAYGARSIAEQMHGDSDVS